MNYEMKSLKTGMKNAILWLSLVLLLVMVAYSSGKAQNCVDKTSVNTIIMSGMKNDTVIISQIKTDSLHNNGSCCSNNMQVVFTYLGKHIDYLPKAIDNKVEGDIIVGFTMTKNGEVANGRIIKGLYSDLNEEVLRVIKEIPKCVPIKEDMDYRVTMNFNLSDGTLVFKPKMSIIGVETSNAKLSVKRMDGKNYGSMIVYGEPGGGEDSVVIKTMSVRVSDMDNSIITIDKKNK